MAILRTITVLVASSDSVTLTRSGTTDGYVGEHLATRLAITVPSSWDTYNAYVTWEAADGWIDESPAFLIGNPAALSFDYDLPFNAMKKGALKCTVTAKTTTGGGETQVVHTAYFTLGISYAPDGTQTYTDDFNDAINDLQDRVSSLEGGSAIANGVAATGVLTDNKIVRGDGGVRNVQTSGITIDDSGNLAGSASISMGTNIVSVGRTQGATGRFGDVAGGNYSEFEADGTLKHNGAASYFEDVPINLTIAKTPAASYPTWTAFKGSEVPAFSKSAVNTLYWSVQFPHKIKEGTSPEFHLHVAYPDAGTGNSVWRMTHSWADLDEAFPSPTTPADVIVAAPGVGGTDKHKLIEIVASITGTGKHISSILLGSISRIGNDGTNDTYDNVIYALSADFHVECDTEGSRTPTAK